MVQSDRELVRVSTPQPPWMVAAWDELGTREVPGRRHSRDVLALFRDAGRQDIQRDEVPWCAAFVGACLERAGETATGSLMARSYLRWGAALDKPRPGAIVVLKRGRNPNAGHVGFCVGETGDQFFLLGGNQSDAVTVTGFAKSRLLGIRWPAVIGSAGHASDSENAIQADNRAERFTQALHHVLEMEGGFTDDPDDPGGPTNQGVILTVFCKHVGRPLTAATRAQRVAELKKISDEVVNDIYRTRYWSPSRAEEMPEPIGFMHFDASVNHGLTGAARLLQRAIRTQTPDLDVDGEIGPLTMGAVRRADVKRLLTDYANARRARYRALHHFWKFGRGWLRRVDRTETRAGALRQANLDRAGRDRASSSTQNKQSEKGNEAMHNSENKTTPKKWWGQSVTIWGAAITALSTVLPVVGPAFGLDVTADIVRDAGNQVISAVQAIGGLVGIVMTIYGRARATQPLERRQLRVQI